MNADTIYKTLSKNIKKDEKYLYDKKKKRASKVKSISKSK